MADPMDIDLDSEIWIKVPVIGVESPDNKFGGIEVRIAGYPMWLTKEEVAAARIEAPE